MASVTIQQLFEALPRFFVPERAAGMDRKIQFHLTGQEAGDWLVHIHEQKLDVLPGQTAANPDLALAADSQVVLDLFAGKLDPFKASCAARSR
jgi:putative sterol carrier protein